MWRASILHPSFTYHHWVAFRHQAHRTSRCPDEVMPTWESSQAKGGKPFFKHFKTISVKGWKHFSQGTLFQLPQCQRSVTSCVLLALGPSSSSPARFSRIATQRSPIGKPHLQASGWMAPSGLRLLRPCFKQVYILDCRGHPSGLFCQVSTSVLLACIFWMVGAMYKTQSEILSSGCWPLNY